MRVAPGDNVTVTIQQVSGTTWQIALTDGTNGQSYVTDQYYDGAGTSAEWIVEAPTSAATNQTVTLADYTPMVSFTTSG